MHVVPRTRWSALLAGLTLALAAQAQDVTGGGFYPFRGNARSVGLAGAFTAVSDDTGGLQFNPAGVAQVKQRMAEGSIKVNKNGGNYYSLSYIEPVRQGKFGGGFTYLRSSDGTGRSDKVFQFTYGQYVYQGLAVGVNLRFHSVKTAATKDDGFAFDFGAMYTPPSQPKFTLGLTALNINDPSFRGIGKAKRVFNAGVAYRPDKYTTLSLDWFDIGSIAKQGQVRFGGERWFGNNIAVRAGVAQRTFGAGVSVAFRYVKLDYGFQRIERGSDLNVVSLAGSF